MATLADARDDEFGVLAKSWDLTLQADGYAANTLISYRRALRHLTGWLDAYHAGTGPAEVTRDHVRGWVVHVREATSSGTARSHFAGVRHFFRWALAEGEISADPTEGVRTPAPNEARTPILSTEDLRALLGTCGSRTFRDRRDRAIIMLFIDGGLRLAELHGLHVDAVDVAARVVLVEGKGSNRSGPRRRVVPIGARCALALDRYLRDRRRHPLADLKALWLGDRGRGPVSADGLDAMLKRRAASVGLTVHPHQFRHTWADGFRAAGGSEGDLMVLGGWRSRAMLDRYGKANAEARARDAYARLSLGDRL